jgi:hypothetical protein
MGSACRNPDSLLCFAHAPLLRLVLERKGFSVLAGGLNLPNVSHFLLDWFSAM